MTVQQGNRPSASDGAWLTDQKYQPLKQYRQVSYLPKATLFMMLITLVACSGGSGGGGDNSDNNGGDTASSSDDIRQLQPAIVDHLSFSEVSLSAGLDYMHGFTDVGGLNEAGIMAGGVAAGDYNADGWVDLYIAQGDTGQNLLYEHQGALTGDITFIEKSAAANVGLSEGSKSCGPLFFDYDGDRDLDLFIGSVVGDPAKLMRNNGDGSFTDVTAGSGFDTLNRQNNFSAAAGDYDLDGDLDLFVSHWEHNIPVDLANSTQHLWRNNGDGTFTDVSDESQVTQSSLEPLRTGELIDLTFTPNFADVNNDGYPDMLLTSDFGTSQVLINNAETTGPITFTNTTDQDVITDFNGMGAAIGDYDNDGDLDWFVSSISMPPNNNVAASIWARRGNRFYRNEGDGTFSDVTDAVGVRTGYWGWGSCFADFNNDGYLDLFHTNGFPNTNGDNWGEDTSRLFIANPDGTFKEMSFELGMQDGKQGRGIVCFDADKDGDIDVFTTNSLDNPTLFRNDGGNQFNYLNIQLRGVSPNTQAIGARIYVQAERLGFEMMREVSAGNNYVSQNPTEQHFGLWFVSVIDTVTVKWPDGQQTVMQDVVANQHLIIDHPDL